MRKTHVLLLMLLCIGAFFRLYNLNWGAPFYFHPDERNIASSVSQLRFPDNMHPHFFAYGSLPIYTIFFTGYLYNLFTGCITTHVCTVSFEQAILISRIYSSIFSILLIPLLFFLGQKLHSRNAGIIAALLTTTSVGLIQYAHFGTFELWLTFFSVCLFLLCLKVLHDKTYKAVFFVSVLCGLLIATKISSLTLVPLLFITYFFAFFQKTTHTATVLRNGIRIILACFIGFIVCVLIYVVTNPYVFIDTQAFLGSIKYESDVALGILPVFYTGEFYGSIPGVFQMLRVYPFLISPLFTMFFIPSFLYVVIQTVRRKDTSWLLLVGFFVFLFLSQAFLFVKWTRYVVPTLPFVYLILAVALSDSIAHKKSALEKRSKNIFYGVFAILTIICFLFLMPYFITALVKEDTRLIAKQYATLAIPHDALILSEVYDLGITPFNDTFTHIDLFNFYDLDQYSPDYNLETLKIALAEHTYIILPSQRIMKTRLQNTKQFPKGNAFYEALFEGKLGFQKIYETSCDNLCKIAYMGDPVFSYEQTVNVFDHPTVYIFKKQ
ncbi:MAG: glycosyltransferase family 39 protein [Candidatus Levybacteria bacterium]|nr:glycosyltransferase family 39 protein [Candidatus Levybacteria bacterium]